MDYLAAHGQPNSKSGFSNDYPESDHLMSVKQAAAFLHVSVNTLRRWSDTGMVRVVRIGERGDRRFFESDILEFLERKTAVYKSGTGR